MGPERGPQPRPDLPPSRSKAAPGIAAPAVPAFSSGCFLEASKPLRLGPIGPARKGLDLDAFRRIPEIPFRVNLTEDPARAVCLSGRRMRTFCQNRHALSGLRNCLPPAQPRGSTRVVSLCHGPLNPSFFWALTNPEHSVPLRGRGMRNASPSDLVP